MSENLAIFFNADTPGYAVTMFGGVAVAGIFDNVYTEAFGGMVAGSGPRFLTSATVAAADGDTISIGGTGYTVTGVEPDGTGMQVLRLEKA